LVINADRHSSERYLRIRSQWESAQYPSK